MAILCLTDPLISLHSISIFNINIDELSFNIFNIQYQYCITVSQYSIFNININKLSVNMGNQFQNLKFGLAIFNSNINIIEHAFSIAIAIILTILLSIFRNIFQYQYILPSSAHKHHSHSHNQPEANISKWILLSNEAEIHEKRREKLYPSSPRLIVWLLCNYASTKHLQDKCSNMWHRFFTNVHANIYRRNYSCARAAAA